jgi:hypothetical protein
MHEWTYDLAAPALSVERLDSIHAKSYIIDPYLKQEVKAKATATHIGTAKCRPWNTNYPVTR